MNQNYFVRCGVCGALHRVRIQAGYLEDYPVRFYCGKCDTPILGTVHLDPAIALVGYSLDAGSLAERIDIGFDEALGEVGTTYLVECSGELLTRKLTEDSLGNPSVMLASNPYFTAVEFMGPEKLGIYVKSMVEAIGYYRNDYPKAASALKLLFKGRAELAGDLIFSLAGEAGPDGPIQRAILMEMAKRLSWQSLPLLADELTRRRAEKAGAMTSELNRVELARLAGFYGDHGESILKLLDGCLNLTSEFVTCFPYLITSFTYQESGEQYDLGKYGTSLCTVEDIRGLYSDCYELLGELICLLIGLDNIAERSSFENMGSGFPARSFENLYSKVSKGKLYECVGGGRFTSLVTECWNRNLRNAFDHNSYEADSRSQAIRIVESDGSIDDGKSVWIAEACCQCIEMLRSILVIREILFILA